MSDLVKNLRDRRFDGQLAMRAEAADRIEELEALVEKYRDAVALIQRWIETGEIPR